MINTKFKLNAICIAMLVSTPLAYAEQENTTDINNDVEVIQVTGSVVH
ncbi:hypothetical protein P4S63_25505 [Pseudoalteromonas sp. B193]